MLILFASVLSGRDRLAFRDIGYFYTPLYQHVAKLCDAQAAESPLFSSGIKTLGPWGNFREAIWNPLDLTGMPLAGETTTAVFYPLRMLVYQLGLSAETAIGVYVALHLIIASLSAYWLARTQRCRPWAAAVAGITYPLSGTVLFLATNPPFLVSAAWLPLAIGPLLDRRQRIGQSGRSIARRSILVPAIAMAMMVLGGDPPTVLHLAIAVTVASFVRWLVDRPVRNQWRSSTLVKLAMSCLLASLLSAPQLAASIDWSSQSDRVASKESPTAESGRNGSSPVTSDSAMAFSFAPWRVVEWALPNFYGTPWPIHHRWDRIAWDAGIKRPETALWTPTVYGGGVLIVTMTWLFSTGSYQKVRRRTRRSRWKRQAGWATIALFGLIASLGAYGGLYGLMLDFVPGYSSLRYPSKWLPLVAIVFSLWSAQAVGFAFRHHRPRHTHPRQPPYRPLAIFVAAGLACVFVAWGVASLIPESPDTADRLWGPFQASLARRGAVVSIAHAMFFAVGLVGLLHWSRRNNSNQAEPAKDLEQTAPSHQKPAYQESRQPVSGVLILAVLWVAADMLVAHHGLVPRINRARETAQLPPTPDLTSPLRWMNTLPHAGVPSTWRQTSDADRMLQVESQWRAAWFGRWHLEHDQAKFNSLVSIRPAAIAQFWQQSKREVQAEPDRSTELWRGYREELGISGLIEQTSGQMHFRVLENDSVQQPDPAQQPDIASHRLTEPELLHFSSKTIYSRPVYQDGHWWAELIPAQQTLTEPTTSLSKAPTKSATPGTLNKSPIEPPKLPLQTSETKSSAAPPIPVPVRRSPIASQAITVPAGQWQVRWRYQPWWHAPALATGWAAWVLVGLFALGWRGFRFKGPCQLQRSK
ncbi:hypothetical protein [Neorhodopirellula lusitana]|uniref:hypothetical protein n=1 Tax=Neorhodopirellula lusitana TaxID=445327 RepID=UPI0024B85D01|nr:hypothetical protein [Neorhodopirellula lusitana]